jgi:DNA polymerase-1
MAQSKNLLLASTPLSEDVLVFDIETNGLLPELHTLHCIAVAPASAKDPEEVLLFHDDPEITPCAGTTQEGVAYLQAHVAQGGKLAGHNIIGYDCPALEKLHGLRFSPEDLYDTTVWSRLIYSDRRERDFRLHEQGRIEGKFIGQHSLASWGNRLGEPKGDPGGDWSTFTQSMADYCPSPQRSRSTTSSRRASACSLTGTRRTSGSATITMCSTVARSPRGP